jgi:hypothetical protein
MTFDAILAQVLDLLQHQGRVAYRALKVRFNLDDDYLEALKDELIYARRLAVDEDGRVLVWMGDTTSVPPPAVPAQVQDRAPLSYTPKHLADKILTTRSALEGERKQVTVLFCDIANSTPLAARGCDREPKVYCRVCFPKQYQWILHAPGVCQAGALRRIAHETAGAGAPAGHDNGRVEEEIVTEDFQKY